MAKKKSMTGVKILSVVGVLLAIGGAFFWNEGAVFLTNAVSKEVSAEVTKPLYYEMKPVIVNISSGSSKTRYLKIRPTLVTRHQSFFDQLPGFEPVIRNHLLSLYSQKSSEDLLRPGGFEALREESLKSLQETLKDETGMLTLSDVLFTEYVIQ